MDIEEYLNAVNGFAEDMNRKDASFELYISDLKTTSATANDCVAFRHEVATPTELASVVGYLATGLFPDPSAERRKAWWLFTFDITRASTSLALEKACEPYTQTQPLFVGAPRLFREIRSRENSGSPDFELIADRAISSVDDSEVYSVGTGYSKLVPQLHSRIPAWARKYFPHTPRYVRLNPWEFHHEQPLLMLMEAALVPANPNWLSTLALFPGMKTFAAYVLQDCCPSENREQYIDYHVHDVRRLEVTAQRREADYLSMMIEELPRDDDPNGLMVGRCIHLDTRATVGTPMAEARLKHLDLAINVYRGLDRAARVADSLQDGKVRDATYRTHLFRIEDVPFPALFGFAEMFLRSRYLLTEWLADIGQLQQTDKDR